MSLIDWFTGARRAANLLGYSSPYVLESNILQPLIAADLLDADTVAQLPLTREVAIGVPAVSKARNLLVAAIAKFPLIAYDGDQPVDVQPEFLYRSTSLVTPYERMAWTIDDLIFYGYSVWLVERDDSGAIVAAEYCPQRYVTITDDHILIDEQERPADQIILFNSPFEGLLNIGSRTVRAARDQENAWVGRARNPIPIVELHQTDDTMTEEEVEKFVKAWSTARTSENGAIGYTPPSLDLKTHGEVAADLMVEGRNAVRTDIGSFLNVRASMLDGTIGIDSLTYTTNEGQRNAFYEFDLPFWTDPIEARLSMDDVVPAGQYVKFNKYSDPNLPAAPAKED